MEDDHVGAEEGDFEDEDDSLYARFEYDFRSDPEYVRLEEKRISLQNEALKEYSRFSWADLMAASEYHTLRSEEISHSIRLLTAAITRYSEKGNVPPHFYSEYAALWEELAVVKSGRAVIPSILEARARRDRISASGHQTLQGDVYAISCRPYIESATSLNHAYAIGYASKFQPFDEAKVASARKQRDRAKYIQSAWETAGFLDANVSAKARLEELKRRIIAYTDDGIVPRSG